MSARPPIERLERLQERITAQISSLTGHGLYGVTDEMEDWVAENIELERELIEIISALKEDPK